MQMLQISLKRTGLLFFTLITTFLLGIVLGIGSLILINKNRDFSLQESWAKLRGVDIPVTEALPESFASEEPVSSPSAELLANQEATPSASSSEKYAQKIVILNATSIPGKAGAFAAKLKEQGYTNVTTGNSSESYEPGKYGFIPSGAQLTIAEMSELLSANLVEKANLSVLENVSENDVVIVIAE